MAEPLPDKPAAELRSLRQLITAPTQQAVDELRKTVARLHGELHTPQELTSLIVPIITEVLEKKIAANATDVSAVLAPIIDKSFAERTEQDRDAIVASLAPSVAKALRKHHDKLPDEVADDLAPIMAAAIRQQVREQRDAMVDALYPIIGSTIAKYMAEALRELLENINQKVERSFTFKGISRKIKARAAGVSEAELILQESLPFTAHAAFLIHKTSGILIAEARNERAKAFDSNLVSGMLTAIRSFVNDWIARTGDVSEIDTIEYGRSKIILEVAGHCYIAVVVEGEPLEEFVDHMRWTLAQIVAEFDKEIAAFEGDSSSLPNGVRERLQSLVEDEDNRPAQKSSSVGGMLALAAFFILVICGPIAWHVYRSHQNEETSQRLSSIINSSLHYKTGPVSVNADGESIRLSGRLPNELLRRRAVDLVQASMPAAVVEDAITIQELPTHPALIRDEVQRITAAFNSIAGVNLTSSFSNGTVSVSGRVTDLTLISRITDAFERLPGVTSLISTFNENRHIIQEMIYFDDAASDVPESEIEKVEAVRKFLSTFPEERIRIIGHCDESGSKARVIPLTLGRAVAVKNILVKMGIVESRIEVEGTGEPLPNIDPTLPTNRCVRFEVIEQSVKQNQ